MDFANALNMMKSGHALTRTEWNDPKAEVILHENKFLKSQNFPVGYYKRTRIPYSFTKDDILAMDWELIR